MPFQPVPETAEFRMQYTWAGQKCENVYHVRYQGTIDATKLNLLAGTFKGWWATTLAPMVAQNVSLERVIGKDIAVDGGVAVEYTTGLPTPGIDSNSLSVPTNVSISVKWGTGMAGRGFRGRTFHIGLPSYKLLNATTITPAHQVALRSAYDALRTALDNATLGVEFVVVSRWYNKFLRMPAITTPISGVSVEANLDSQRRRLAGRGQ